MRHFGHYEPVIEAALGRVRVAPWSIEDLTDAESWIGDEQCRQIYPHCRPQDVIAWLHSLSAADRAELVAHLNAEKAKKGTLRD